LYYLDEVVGTGLLAETHDTAYIMFSGYFLDGTKFLTNVGSTDTLIVYVNEATRLPGIDEAITYMREGGKSKALLPSYLGYGNAGYYVPAYTPLLFDLELKRLIKGPGSK
jgi:peptidylprolyl isomerase